MIDPQKLTYNHTHFYVQLEEILPIRAVPIKRLEVDTPEDLRYAEQVITACASEYDFWR